MTNADKEGMDLSKVLDDVYDASNSKPTLSAASAPAWADEQRLDEVFSSWTPGPPADAPAAEREMAGTLDDETAGAIARILAPGEGEPAIVTFPAVEVEPDPVAAALYAEAPAQAPRWLRGDDDVHLGGPEPEERVSRRRSRTCSPSRGSW